MIAALYVELDGCYVGVVKGWCSRGGVLLHPEHSLCRNANSLILLVPAEGLEPPTP
jgi:hypothetical protein